MLPRALLVPLLLLAAAVLVLDAKPLEPCPSSCRCYLSEGLKRADCRHVPEWADRQSDAQDVRILPPPAARGARASALQLTHFEVFPKVLQLSVTNRSLLEVIPSGFHGLHSLQTLDLSNNLLARFNQKVFLRMPALQRLVLAGNPIALEKDVPLLRSKSLLSLDLSHCDIVAVPRGSLDGARNLTSLSLRGNPLRLEKGRPLLGARSTVTELDLSDCALDTVPDGVLDVLVGLRRLYLDNNRLHTLQGGVLPRGLHHLDLSGNQLRDVPTPVLSSFRNLTKLELSDNPVRCTCSLIGMQGWLSRRPVAMERAVVCAEPPQYRGKSWTKVDGMALCRAEESNSTTDTSETSSSSDESSDDDDDDEDDDAAGPVSDGNGLQTAYDDSLLDSLEDLNSPASYEHYTHENGLGLQSSAMPMRLKVHTLDAAAHPPRVVSHNDINYQADQADQPYEQSTPRPGQDDGDAATTAAPAEHAENDEHDEHNGHLEHEEHVERAENAEPLESEADDAEDGGDEDADAEDADAEDADVKHDEDATEKDAEVFERTADQIAMGKSMPEEAEKGEKEAEAEHSTVAAAAIPVTEEPTAAPVTEHVTEAADTETPAVAVTGTEATHEDVEHAEDHPEQVDSTEQHLAEATLVDGATEQPPTEAAPEHVQHEGEQHKEHEGEHEGELEEVAAATAEGEASTEAPTTTTVAADELPVVPAGPAEGDRSAYGRALEGEGQGGADAEGEQPEGEHHEEHGEGGVPVVVPEPETVTSPSPTENVENEGGADSVPVVPAVPELPAEATTPPSEPVVEEEIVPEVAKNVVGVEIAAPEEPTAPPAAAAPEAEREPAMETIDAPKSAPEVEAIPVPVPDTPVEIAAPEAAADPVENGTPDADAETVAAGTGAGSPDDKHNEELAVQRVTPGPGEASDPEAELQKSTITYVILGCIVLAMIVLVLYALLRSKAKQPDNGSGGKPVSRVRRENGDALGPGHPEGTEMKDMMNPLLSNGQAADHAEHGRRASLVSLELIREEDDETSRLQPAGADEDEGTLPRAKGAADAPKTPEPVLRTGNGKAAVPNGKSNGEANGKANGTSNGKANGKPAAASELAATPTTPASDPAATPRTQRAAEQPSKVKVKAGIISTPVPRTPVLVNRSNGVNGKANGKTNGVNRSA